MKRLVALAVLGVLVAGCASSAPPAPSVYVAPLKGQSGEQQLRDQNDCMLIAKGQTGYDPATETAKGAGVGALIGAVGGAAAGAAIGAASGATIGAVGGGAYQYSKSKEGYERAYANCMIGRGYSVR